MNLPNIDQRLEELKAANENLLREVHDYVKMISELQANKTKAEESLANAEERASLAEQRERDANEKYKKALDLRDGQYEGLIHDLFEVPKNNLERTIRDVSHQSIYVALLLAASSMGLTLGIAITSRITKPISVPPQVVDGRTDSTSQIERYLLVERIVEKIITEKAKFSGLVTKNDLATAYKITIGQAFENARYEDFISAFNRAGLARDVVPNNEDDFRQWDEEFVRLCQNAISSLEWKIWNEKPTELERRYASFRSAGDSTPYGNWECPQSRQTYSELLLGYRTVLAKFQTRLELNKS